MELRLCVKEPLMCNILLRLLEGLLFNQKKFAAEVKYNNFMITDSYDRSFFCEIEWKICYLYDQLFVWFGAKFWYIFAWKQVEIPLEIWYINYTNTDNLLGMTYYDTMCLYALYSSALEFNTLAFICMVDVLIFSLNTNSIEWLSSVD